MLSMYIGNTEMGVRYVAHNEWHSSLDIRSLLYDCHFSRYVFTSACERLCAATWSSTVAGLGNYLVINDISSLRADGFDLLGAWAKRLNCAAFKVYRESKYDLNGWPFGHLRMMTCILDVTRDYSMYVWWKKEDLESLLTSNKQCFTTLFNWDFCLSQLFCNSASLTVYHGTVYCSSRQFFCREIVKHCEPVLMTVNTVLSKFVISR